MSITHEQAHLILVHNPVLSNEGAGKPVQMCSYTQQNLCCSYTQSKSVDENTGQIAVSVRVIKDAFTMCDKKQNLLCGSKFSFKLV